MGVNLQFLIWLLQKFNMDFKNNFKAVSVREEKAAELFAPYLTDKPQVVVDPTLLLTSEEWLDIFPEDAYEGNDYVFASF